MRTMANFRVATTNASLTTILAATTIGLSVATVSSASAAGFSGPYDPSKATLRNTNADGFVNTSDAPNSITLTGGNTESGLRGTTDYTFVADASGIVNFDYRYFSPDDPGGDGFEFLLNGTTTSITDRTGESGNFRSNVGAGDIFGFRIFTLENEFGRGSARISNFSAPVSDPVSVPEPSSLFGLVALGGMMTANAIKKAKK